MLRLLAHRATAQLPLLAAVVAVVTIGATLLGVCALLLTTSQERALESGMARAAPDDVEVTAYVTDVKGKDARSVADDTRALVTRTLAPLAAPTAGRASSMMRPLAGDAVAPKQLGYLSGVDGLASRARLTAGRWPQPQSSGQDSSGRARSLEAVVLEPTAQLLNLALGSHVRMKPEIGNSDASTALTVAIVGIFRPLPDAGWDRDPLDAAGYDPAFLSGGPTPDRAYGPFVVDMADLFASGSTIDRLQVSAQPDLSAPTSATLNTVAASLTGADARLRRLLGDRVKLERVASDLPYTLGLAYAQQAVTRSTVLVVVLLGIALTAAALGLAGRLIAALRASETALLSVLGASRGQLAVVAAVEAVLLAALAAALAVPLSGLGHAALTHLPALADAGLAARPEVTGDQVLAIVVGAVLLAGVLVVPVLRPNPELVVAARGRLGLLARSGADLLLLGVAAVGWWQLQAQPTTEVGTDAVRVLAPVVCLLAGAALAPRLVSLPLRAAERLAQRSQGLVLALAAFEAARRPRAVAAGLLLALAAAAGTFGLAFGATWERSQQDQADTRVGTDLALALTSPAVTGQGASIAAATGGTVSPVTDRGIVVGRWVGHANDGPRIVAVDSTRAGTLLHGRLPDETTWSQVGAELAPGTAVTGLALPAGSEPGLTLTGTSTPGSPLQVVPRLVLQDRDGLRTRCEVAAVALDGRPHPLRLCGPVTDGVHIVAMALRVNLTPAAQEAAAEEAFSQGTTSVVGTSKVTVALNLPGAQGSNPAAWAAASVGPDPGRLFKPMTRVSATPAATVLQTTATVDVTRLLFGDSAEVVTTAFQPPKAVPVAASRRLSDELGASVGDRLTVAVGGTAVPAVVVRLVPAVPSAPGEIAMLADVDVLSRALITAGDLEPAVDAWWVGKPTTSTEPGVAGGAAANVAALGLGRVETRTQVLEQLSRGPLRVGLPAALIVLVPAAVLLVLAGTVMHVTSDVEARALEMARLRGLGVGRRSVLGGLLAQHGGVLALLLGAGALLGAVSSWALGPLLIRSDLGAAPVPTAVALWPWPAEAALLAVLLLGGMAVIVLVVVVQLRRANTAHLRVGS